MNGIIKAGDNMKLGHAKQNYTKHGNKLVKIMPDGDLAVVKKAKLYLIGQEEPVIVPYNVKDMIMNISASDRNMIIEISDDLAIAYGQITRIETFETTEKSVIKENAEKMYIGMGGVAYPHIRVGLNETYYFNANGDKITETEYYNQYDLAVEADKKWAVEKYGEESYKKFLASIAK